MARRSRSASIVTSRSITKDVHAHVMGDSAVENMKLRERLMRKFFIVELTAAKAPDEAAALPNVPTMMSTSL